MADNKKTLVEFMYGPSAAASAQNNISSKSALPTSNISAQQSIESIDVKNIPKFITPLNFLPGRGINKSEPNAPSITSAFTQFSDLNQADKLKEAFLNSMGTGAMTSEKSSPFFPKIVLPEKTVDQKVNNLHDFIKDPIEYKPVYLGTKGIMPIIEFQKVDNSKANNENTNTFLNSFGTTIEHDDMGAPSINFADISSDNLETAQQNLEKIRNKKIKDLDGELNIKMNKELRELKEKNKYDSYGSTGAAGFMGTGGIDVVGGSLENLAIVDKYEKLKQEGYKKIKDQYKGIVDDFIYPHTLKKLPVLDDKSAIGLAMDNPKDNLEGSITNNITAISNIDKTIKDFSLTGNKIVDLDGEKKSEVYARLMNDGIKSVNVYDQHDRNIALGNANFGKNIGEVYGSNLSWVGKALEGLGFKDVDRTTGMSQIEKDEYASIGLRDQISIMSSYARSLSNGKDGALDKLNAIDTTNIKPEQLKEFIAYKNSVKANYDKIEQLKNTMLAWGEENLKSYNKELATQKFVTEQANAGILNSIGSSVAVGANYIAKIPNVIGDMAEKIKYRGKDYQQKIRISPENKQTATVEELLEAQINTRRESDSFQPQVIDFKTGQLTDLSEAEATRLFGEDGKFVGFNNIVSARPLLYQGIKMGIDSMLLGGIGGAIEATVTKTALKLGGEKILQFGAQQAIKAELSQATRLAESNLIGNLTGKEVMWKALDGTINLSTSGLKIANKLGSMVIPTGLLFGNEMYDGYRAKGFTPEQAMNLTKIGIFIEGGTEAIFGNEVKLFNAFIGKEATLAEKKLANEIFEKAIGSKFIKQTGRAATTAEMSLFKKLYINAKKFANSNVSKYTVEGFKVGGEEVIEEVIGNAGTALFIEPLAKKYDPTFEGQGFKLKDQLNTMLTTMATMLPMMGTAGYHHIQNEKLEALSSKYEVGANPGYHLNTLIGMFKNGDINQEQYQKAVNYVSDYEKFHAKANHDVNNSQTFKDYNIKEKENAKIKVFAKQLEKSDIENQLLNAVTDKQKAVFAEKLSKIDNELINYIDNGEYTSKEQRVAANIFQLDYLYNNDTLQHYNSGKLSDVIQILTKQKEVETDEKLKDVYQKKIDLLSNKLKNDVVEHYTNNMQKEELETSLKNLTENNPDQVKELEDLRLINKDREIEKWKKENPNAKEEDLLAQVKIISTKYKMETDLPLIEAYQKAKKDNSNPELVQAFEKAFNIAPEVVEVKEVEAEEKPSKKEETPKEKVSTAKETTKKEISRPIIFKEALKYMEAHPDDFTEAELEFAQNEDNPKKQQEILKKAQDHYNKTYGTRQDYINRINSADSIEELESVKQEMFRDSDTQDYEEELNQLIENKIKNLENKNNIITFGDKEYTVGSFVTIKGEGNKLYQIKGLNDNSTLRLEFLGKGATINLSDPKDIMTTLSEEKGLEQISKMAKEKAKEKAAETEEGNGNVGEDIKLEKELSELSQKQLTKGFNNLSEATKPEQVANAIVNIEQNKNQGARLSREQEQQLSEAKAKLKEQGYEIIDYNIVRNGENTIVQAVDFYDNEKDVLTQEQANAIESKINSLEKKGEEVDVDDLPSPVSRTIKPLIKKDGVMVQAVEVNTLIFESVEQAREAIKKSREAGNKKLNAADKIKAKYKIKEQSQPTETKTNKQTEKEMKEEKKESEDTLNITTENLEDLLDNETFMNESVDKGNNKSLEELMEELKKSNKDKC